MRYSLLAATALTAISLPVMAVDVKLYGVVDKALMVHDDGESTESTIVDNNLESTRFGMVGEQKLDNGLTAGVLFEVEHASNPSNQITQAGTGTKHSQANTPAGVNNGLTERTARVGLAGNFGAVFLGRQDVASDDAFTHDLGAATSVMNANVAAFGGNLNFRRETAGTFSNLTAGGTTLNANTLALDMSGGLDAADSIRYNSPEFYGFNGSASFAQGGNIDGNLRYAGEVGDFAMDGAIAYKWANSNDATATNELEGQLYGSASIKHKSGVAATLAYTRQDIARKTAGVDDPSGWYAKVGYAWDAFGLAIDYANFRNAVQTATDHELASYGIGGEYDMGRGVTLGAMFRTFDAKVSGITNDEDINVGVVNMKVKF